MTEKVRADDGLGFDNVPEIYDRVRPAYPPELFDELFAYLRDGDALRGVEIGPGTGKATRPLLEHGIAVTAVEPVAHKSTKIERWEVIRQVGTKSRANRSPRTRSGRHNATGCPSR